MTLETAHLLYLLAGGLFGWLIKNLHLAASAPVAPIAPVQPVAPPVVPLPQPVVLAPVAPPAPVTAPVAPAPTPAASAGSDLSPAMQAFVTLLLDLEQKASLKKAAQDAAPLLNLLMAQLGTPAPVPTTPPSHI